MTSYDILTRHLGARVEANDAEEVWSTDGTSTSSVQMRSDAFSTQSYNEAKHVASPRRAPSALKVWHCEPFSVCFSEQKML